MATRQQYQAARKLVRENGNYAFRWIDDQYLRFCMVSIADKTKTDQLAERAWIRREFGQAAIAKVIRQDAPTGYRRWPLLLPLPR